MIPIVDIYRRVLDLSRKGRSGYLNAEEFTRHCNEAQDLLFRFYFKKYEEDQIITDALRPFVKDALAQLTNSRAPLPADYRHKIAVSVFRMNQGSYTQYPIQFIRNHEVDLTRISPIRKPVLSEPRSWRYSIADNFFSVVPEMEGGYKIVYLCNPPNGKYAVTINGGTDEEDYDAGNSIDLIWNTQEMTNIIDLVLFLIGFQVKDNEIIQFARKNLITLNQVT